MRKSLERGLMNLGCISIKSIKEPKETKPASCSDWTHSTHLFIKTGNTYSNYFKTVSSWTEHKKQTKLLKAQARTSVEGSSKY